MKQWITNFIVIGLALAFLVHFTMIAMWGQVLIQEPNTIILVLEIVGLIVIMGFAISNLVHIARRGN